MSRDDTREPCLDLFWEQADAEAAADHPLERELRHRLDALTRYDRMIARALDDGHDGVLENLAVHRERQQAAVDALRRALGRYRRGGRFDATRDARTRH